MVAIRKQTLMDELAMLVYAGIGNHSMIDVRQRKRDNLIIGFADVDHSRPLH
jgi:hypothetical protein